MARLWEWGIAGVTSFLAGYTFAQELWIHSAWLFILSVTLIYLTLEPSLMRIGLIKISVFDRISR